MSKAIGDRSVGQWRYALSRASQLRCCDAGWTGPLQALQATLWHRCKTLHCATFHLPHCARVVKSMMSVILKRYVVGSLLWICELCVFFARLVAG